MRVVLFLLCLFLASPIEATTFYVRTDGNNANAGTANTSGGAWATIAKGLQAAAGSIVRVQAGTYIETAAASTSGTLGNTLTIVADGTVITCGISFSSKSYIRIIGIKFSHAQGGCPSSGTVISSSGTNTGIELWNFDINGNSAGPTGIAFDLGNSSGRCNACIIIGGAIHDVGFPGSATGIVIDGDDNYIGYTNFTTIDYIGVGPSGSRSRFINLNFSGLIQNGGTHPDNFYIHVTALPYSNGVIESMFVQGTPTSSDNKIYHAQNESPAPPWNDDILRFSVAYNMGSASSHSIYVTWAGGQINRWRQYNNDHIYGNRAVSGDQFDECGGGNGTGGNITVWILNSIYDHCWADDVSVRTHVNPFNNNIGTYTTDYNLAFDPAATDTFQTNWTSQVHEQTNVDPLLNNIAGLDFTLQAGSGNGANARGTGGPLTTATSCSGTILNVATNTGTFFVGDNSINLPQYNGVLVPGDFLTVNGTIHQVSSVSGDAITLADSITCLNGAAVYFGKSSTIDIGAYPYKVGGYSLSATYSINGGVATIVPNDNSLVRFVVCYDSNVPATVINTPPYTCTPGGGAFLARVYPQYASQTLSVDASLSTVNPNRFRYFRKKGD